jgi:hypothetical protein
MIRWEVEIMITTTLKEDISLEEIELLLVFLLFFFGKIGAKIGNDDLVLCVPLTLSNDIFQCC